MKRWPICGSLKSRLKSSTKQRKCFATVGLRSLIRKPGASAIVGPCVRECIADELKEYHSVSVPQLLAEVIDRFKVYRSAVLSSPSFFCQRLHSLPAFQCKRSDGLLGRIPPDFGADSAHQMQDLDHRDSAGWDSGRGHWVVVLIEQLTFCTNLAL